ncbi:hypothetical protein OE88DRAFT_728596 [Heliocybe sulcata]|uniref:Uncharacterized protein n=1 Tax=Heliocybe sulcata TaxID=5364 RepID=A0A5C3NJI7_9AGAM|nr:hypothetical protein OE88DRAFT_728596 [Heliocybe sulcata]
MPFYLSEPRICRGQHVAVDGRPVSSTSPEGTVSGLYNTIRENPVVPREREKPKSSQSTPATKMKISPTGQKDVGNLGCSLTGQRHGVLED